MEETIPTSDNTMPKRSYKTLWIMILLFGMPYLAAWYFYFNQDDITLAAKTNYGELINPVREMPDVQLTTIDGDDFSTADLKGKWTIVSIADSACTGECRNNLYKMRQIRKALGQDRYRVERLFLLTDTQDVQSFAQLLDEYEGTVVLINQGDDHFTKLLSRFEEPGKSTRDKIYIIDPLGNYMMAYPQGAEAKGILKDLTRLLKVSKIG